MSWSNKGGQIFAPRDRGETSRCPDPELDWGRETALDITVINPLQARLVSQAANTAGHALDTAYNRKMVQAGEACRREGIVFLPMPMEALGGWQETTELQMKKLAAA